MKCRQNAISWLLHSLKIILGDESIRRYITLHYYPDITNQEKKYMKTFDAFIQNGKTRQDKIDKIKTYCEKIRQKVGVIVFTATNIQQDKLDFETHFQSYIVNNNIKKVVVVDPAYDKKNENNAGIYMAEVSYEVVIPFFKENGYEIEFVDLSTPAQISEGDVFCQSWSLYILLQKLKQNEYLYDKSFEIPEKQLDKYDMLLEFYKQIFKDMPELHDNLRTEYEEEIKEAEGLNSPTQHEKEQYLLFNPIELLLDMSKYEMK
jgi:hypothetical protein